jgi:hypothetical protein
LPAPALVTLAAIRTADAFELAGYGGRPLPCVLHRCEGARGTAVVLPGGARAGGRLGGTPARPDLNYVRVLLLELGEAVLEVWWDTDSVPAGEEEAWLAASARAAAAAATPLLVGVGRSWGTRALAKLVLEGAAPSTTVWLAPLLGHPDVTQAVARAGDGACVVAGTADELVPEPELRRAEAAGATVIRIAGASHALEVGGAAASARALADALDELHVFLERSR